MKIPAGIAACTTKTSRRYGIFVGQKLDEIKHVDLKLVWDPPWTKDKMSKVAKLELNL